MALIHERLYQSDNLADIDFADYLPKLASHLHRSYAVECRSISVAVNCASVRLPLDLALPCALIASELISNALKHAYVGRSEGALFVQMLPASDGLVELEVSDDGIGMPQEIAPEVPPTLGMQLIAGLVRQLEGTLTIRRGIGTAFTLIFPAGAASPRLDTFPPVNVAYVR
jgi:two-component sensor histidine kinase